MKKGKIVLSLIGSLLCLLWLVPFYLMIVNSFKTKKEIFVSPINMPKSLNFTNYIQAANNLRFLKTFFNSIVITVFSIVVIIVFSSMAAYALARIKSKVSKIIFFIFVSAMLIPFQAVMIPLILSLIHI